MLIRAIKAFSGIFRNSTGLLLNMQQIALLQGMARLTIIELQIIDHCRVFPAQSRRLTDRDEHRRRVGDKFCRPLFKLSSAGQISLEQRASKKSGLLAGGLAQ